MKTKTLKLAVLALGLSAAVLTSCKGIETVEPTEDQIKKPQGTATITGMVEIDTDATESDDDKAAEGVEIMVTYNEFDLLTATGAPVTRSTTVKTNGEGKFTFSLPSTFDGVTYKLEFIEFYADYKYEKTVDGTVEKITETRVFEGPSQDVTLKSGQTKTLNLKLSVTPTKAVK